MEDKQYKQPKPVSIVGSHYKKKVVQHEDIFQPVDPAWIATKYPMSPMMFTVLKKCLRCGSSIKTREQDIEDIISACTRELELISLEKVKNKA